MTIVRHAPLLLLPLLLGGCEGVQTAFGGDGEHTRQFITLFTIFLAVCTVMYLLVVAAMVAGLVRRRRPADEAKVVESRSHHRSSAFLKPLLIAWTALIATGLAGLTIASYVTDRTHAAVSPRESLWIEVTGHRWWWDVRYVSKTPAGSVRTANEIHLPVGVPARIRLHSNDVIHSVWVPNLAGKQDLIPGRTTDITLLPTRTGYFRGQCAEFCGIQHAHMNLDVVVHSREDFKRWYRGQLQPAPPPRSPLARAGYEYVTTRECQMCHTVAGTPANGRVAPDLTHVASRRSIAAGTLPMTRGHLYAWIADPQSQKPGNQMPVIPLQAQELHAVVSYLETLK